MSLTQKFVRRGHASSVGDARAFSHPHAVVDDAAKMLDEMTVEIGRDRRNRLVQKDVDACGDSARCPGGRRLHQRRQAGAGERLLTDQRAGNGQFEKVAAIHAAAPLNPKTLYFRTHHAWSARGEGQPSHGPAQPTSLR
jgi:hypothetical protein